MKKNKPKFIRLELPLSPVRGTRTHVPVNMAWVNKDKLEALPEAMIGAATKLSTEEAAELQERARARAQREAKQRANQIANTTYIKAAGGKK